MIKKYIVAGANWTAKVSFEDTLGVVKDIPYEIATRAVEAFFNKRSDIKIKRGVQFVSKQPVDTLDDMHDVMIDLLSTELIAGCGIGMLIMVMDDKNPANYKTGESHEWFIQSKDILSNVGLPTLIDAFNTKYPDNINQKI